MLASAAAAAAAVHKPRSGGSRGPAGPRDMPSAGSGGGRRRRREELAAAQPRRAARPLASPGRCGTRTHTHSHTRTHTHSLAHSHTHPRACGPGYAGCQAIGPAGRGRGREGGVSGISRLDRCESISGHFPAAFPAPLPLCVQGTQPLLPAQQRHSVAVSHTFFLWSLGSSREEEQREAGTLSSTPRAQKRCGNTPGASSLSPVGFHGGGRARAGAAGRGMQGPCDPQGRTRVCPEPAGPGRAGGNPAHPPGTSENVPARPESGHRVLAGQKGVMLER